MENSRAGNEGNGGEAVRGGWRASFVEAARFWEPRRLIYNAVLTAIVGIWVAATWPHFRPAMRPGSLVFLLVMATLANLCYSAAYLVDVPVLRSDFGAASKRKR